METANFGTVLREARERRQVSLADVARQTKVSVTALQLLEAGKFADLPHETFVRGFIRSYARTVGISHVEPLSLFDEAVAARRNAETPLGRSLAPRTRLCQRFLCPKPAVTTTRKRRGMELAWRFS
jgi:cytoskeletal protein RodZ